MDISNFISPKQLIEIKREIVEQALARANPIIAMEYKDGIVLMAENPSDTLNKASEIYDRIAFAGTGVYNDYERLRRAGVQYADVKGFSYSRRDVKAKAIATEYSSILGDIFTRQQVPWEVEILVVEIGDEPVMNRMYVIPFSGGLVEEKLFCAIGDIYRDKEGEYRKNVLRKRLQEKELSGQEPLERAVRTGSEVLNSLKDGASQIPAKNLEVVILDRTLKRNRKVRRLPHPEVETLIAG
jgi:proteasome alpha subunit